MADDLTTTTTVSTIPDGTKIVTDEHVTRGHMQVVKLAYSADGDATYITADAGGLLVNLGANNDVTVTGTITAELSATDNAVLDQIELNTDPLLVVGGGVEATAIRVTIANNSTGLVSVDDNGGALTVDWAGTAPPIGAGLEATALRVTLATDSTGVVSVDDNGGAITVDWAGTAPPIGAGTEAAALRVTLATNSTGLVSVDDNGGALTVDWAGTAPPIGAGVEATALRVTLATDSTGVVSVDDNGAALSVDWNGTAPVTGSGNATGALRVELANNGTGILATVGTVTTVTTVSTVTALGAGTTGPMKAEDVGHVSGDQGFPAWGVRTDVPNAVGAGSTGDYSFLATDMAGGIRTALYETDFAVLGTKHVKKYYANTGAVTDGIVWSTAAGARWYITDLIFTISAAATITFEDDLAGGDVIVLAGDFAANSGVAHHFATPLFSGEDAADLIVTTSAGNIKVTVVGYEI